MTRRVSLAGDGACPPVLWRACPPASLASLPANLDGGPHVLSLLSSATYALLDANVFTQVPHFHSVTHSWPKTPGGGVPHDTAIDAHILRGTMPLPMAAFPAKAFITEATAKSEGAQAASQRRPCQRSAALARQPRGFRGCGASSAHAFGLCLHRRSGGRRAYRGAQSRGVRFDPAEAARAGGRQPSRYAHRIARAHAGRSRSCSRRWPTTSWRIPTANWRRCAAQGWLARHWW